jgi:hypothetical protein
VLGEGRGRAGQPGWTVVQCFSPPHASPVSRSMVAAMPDGAMLVESLPVWYKHR